MLGNPWPWRKGLGEAERIRILAEHNNPCVAVAIPRKHTAPCCVARNSMRFHSVVGRPLYYADLCEETDRYKGVLRWFSFTATSSLL